MGAERALARGRGAVGQLADERHQLGPVDGSQVVDDPLGVRLLGTRGVEVLTPQLGDDYPSVRELRRPLERAGEQLQLRERRRLVHLDEHLAHVGTRLDELSGKTERLGRRIRVLETAGVRDDGRVERLRDRVVQLDPERDEDVREHLRGGRCVVDDEVDVPEARVVVMVVDVHGQPRRLDQRLFDDPALLGAVDGDEHALSCVRRRRPDETARLELEKRVLAWQRRLTAEHHHGVLSERLERELRRDQRAERVTVRVLVRRDDEAVACAQSLDDGARVSRLHRRLRRAARARR